MYGIQGRDTNAQYQMEAVAKQKNTLHEFEFIRKILFRQNTCTTEHQDLADVQGSLNITFAT